MDPRVDAGPLAQWSESEQAGIRSALDSYLAAGPEGVAVAIARPGYENFSTAAGSASSFEAFSSDTVSEVGSVTKTMSAVLVLRALEQGRLALDDTAATYVPLLEALPPITVEQLLTHTSGLVSYTGIEAFWTDTQRAWTHDELLSLVIAQPLEFTPGTSWNYSNSGYFVLGIILESVFGQSYHEVLRDEIFAPLEMNASGYCDTDAHTQDRAQGFTNGQANDSVHMSGPFAAGAVCSTAADLLRFSQALFDEELVDSATMKGRERLPDGQLTPYGQGLFIGRSHWRDTMGHGGNIPGFTARVTYYPALDAHVTLVSNRNGADLAALEATLVQALFGSYQHAPFTPSAADVQAFVGSYSSSLPGIPPISITAVGDELNGTFGGADALLTPAGSPSDFDVAEYNLRVRFLSAPTRLELEQAGYLFTLGLQP